VIINRRIICFEFTIITIVVDLLKKNIIRVLVSLP
jgi:hypothetical protein